MELVIEFIENNIVLLPLLFIVGWVASLQLLSTLGGWRHLGKKYSAQERFTGEKWHMQSLSLGWVNYSGCITLGASPSHMYMAVIAVFKVAHPDLLVPWDEIEGRETKGIIFQYVDIRFRGVPQIKLKLFKKQADLLEVAAKGAWSYVRI